MVFIYIRFIKKVLYVIEYSSDRNMNEEIEYGKYTHHPNHGTKQLWRQMPHSST